jgi:hypothetical protein
MRYSQIEPFQLLERILANLSNIELRMHERG